MEPLEIAGIAVALATLFASIWRGRIELKKIGKSALPRRVTVKLGKTVEKTKFNYENLPEKIDLKIVFKGWSFTAKAAKEVSDAT